jgi:hypothetical protein
METFLRCFVSTYPNKWLECLSFVEYWYNTSYHSSIGQSPFEALYGYSPHSFGLYATNNGGVRNLDSWLQECQVMPAHVKQHLHQATLRMKHQEDKHHSKREFVVGDLIFLKLQPYV